MSEWKEYKLIDLVEPERGISYGIVQPGVFQAKGGVPILKVNNLTENKTTVLDVSRVSFEVESKYQKTRLKGNEILISVVGSLGHMFKVQKAQIGWNVVRAIAVLPIKEGLNRDWIYYYLSSPVAQDRLVQMAMHTVQATLNLKELKQIMVPIPPIATQTSIAEILSSIDDKIELNNKINQELENLAQTLFKQWFIDFEFPNENGEPYKSSGGEMVENELGEIPKGWEVMPIRDVFDFISGYPFKGESFSKSGKYGIVTIKNVQDGKFVQDTDNFIDDLPNKFPQNAILNIGDILMSLTGNVGRVCFVTKENCVLNQRVVKFKGKQENSNAFWYYFFRQTLVKELLISISKGTAQLNLSPVETKSLKFALPKFINENLLAAFTEIFNYEVACSIENNELTNLRDTLLPKLISGELEVSQTQTTA